MSVTERRLKVAADRDQLAEAIENLERRGLVEWRQEWRLHLTKAGHRAANRSARKFKRVPKRQHGRAR